MCYLEHFRENKRITRPDFESARTEFYRQWRDSDGSIPWRIICDGWEVSPVTGDILNLA